MRWSYRALSQYLRCEESFFWEGYLLTLLILPFYFTYLILTLCIIFSTKFWHTLNIHYRSWNLPSSTSIPSALRRCLSLPISSFSSLISLALLSSLQQLCKQSASPWNYYLLFIFYVHLAFYQIWCVLATLSHPNKKIIKKAKVISNL